MTYNTNPTAKYVRDFAERMRTQFSRQNTLDEEVRLLESLDQHITAAKPAGQEATPGKKLESGLWNQLVRRDAATITISPFIRFNPPDPTDDDAKKHASLLEAWTNSGLLVSGMTPLVDELCARSLVGYGRSWTNICHDPRIWADEEMKQMVDRKQELLDEGKDSEDKEVKAIDKDIDAYKRDRWPIRLRYVDPIGTYAYSFGSPRHLPEVVEIRRMTLDHVESEYQIKPKKDGKGDTEIDVYVYANHLWEMTVVGKEDPQEAHKFKHDLGKSPYTLEESNLLPVSTPGIRWLPALYHAKGMMEAFDRVLTDWETNTTWNALGITVQSIDPDLRGLEGTGRPPKEDIHPGDNVTVWKGEELNKGPVPELTAEHANHRNFLYSMIRENATTPVLQGEVKSDTSQTLVANQVQIAERKFKPSVEARKAAQVDRAKTMLRAVGALNKHYPNYPDKVWVHDQFKDKGAIGIGPKDILGWMNTLQARGEPAIPLDAHRKWSVAQLQAERGVPESVILEEMGYEDPESIIRQGMKEAARRALFENVWIPEIIKRAQADIQMGTAQREAKFQELLAQAPPEVQQAMMMAMGGMQPGMAPPQGMPPQGPPMGNGMGAPPQPMGSVMQAASNVARAGVPQEARKPI